MKLTSVFGRNDSNSNSTINNDIDKITADINDIESGNINNNIDNNDDDDNDNDNDNDYNDDDSDSDNDDDSDSDDADDADDGDDSDDDGDISSNKVLMIMMEVIVCFSCNHHV